MSDLTVIVLAAGHGKRMKSKLPKVMHSIGGRSMLGHVLAAVDALGADRVVVVVGHGREQVRAHVQDAMNDYARRSNRQDWQLDARWLLGKIELPDETREAILGHAEGLGARHITAEQQAIRDAHAHEGQGPRSVLDDDPFEGERPGRIGVGVGLCLGQAAAGRD